MSLGDLLKVLCRSSVGLWVRLCTTDQKQCQASAVKSLRTVNSLHYVGLNYSRSCSGVKRCVSGFEPDNLIFIRGSLILHLICILIHIKEVPMHFGFSLE